MSVKIDLAGGGRYKTQECSTNSGLSTAAFSDEAEGPAGLDLKAYPVNCLNHGGNLAENTLSHREMGFQALDLNKMFVCILDSKNLIFKQVSFIALISKQPATNINSKRCFAKSKIEQSL